MVPPIRSVYNCDREGVKLSLFHSLQANIWVQKVAKK